MSEKKSRRSFFKTAAAGGVLLASPPKAHAKRRQYKRKSPASVELIEVGIITCAYYSHIEDIWGLFLNPPLEERRGTFWPRTTGMVMTYVWDPDREAAEKFAKKYDVKVAKNFYDMVNKVDAVILSDFYATGWWLQLSKPYLEAGMPTLINRPFAFSLREANEMIERSKKYNAPILVPSSDETMNETLKLRRKLERLLEEDAFITGAMATEPCGEYPAHGLHSIYNLYTVLNPKVIAASLQADTWWEFKTPAFMTWRCTQEEHPDYYVGIQMTRESYTFGWVMVSTSKDRIMENNDRPDDSYGLFKNAFVPTMLEFAKMVETGKMPQTHEFIMAKTTTFLTGFYSHCEKDGHMVQCADLPEDWRAPEVMPERIPDNIFE